MSLDTSLLCLFPNYKSPTFKLARLFLSICNTTTSLTHPILGKLAEDGITAFNFPVNCTKNFYSFKNLPPLFSPKKIIKDKFVSIKQFPYVLGSCLSSTQNPDMAGRRVKLPPKMVSSPSSSTSQLKM